MIRAARPLLLLATVALAAASRAQEVLKDQIYLKQGGAAFTMDVFKPAKPNGMAVIFVMSGGWFSDHSMINAGVAKGFNDNGITLIQVVHGSQPLYKIPQIEGQIVRSVRYVRANAARFGIDPKRIGMVGMSAGGHLTLMTAATGDDGNANSADPVEQASSRLQAAVAYYPPTDFLNWGGSSQVPMSEAQMAPFIPAFGVDPKGPKPAIDARLREVSPIYRITAQFPPTLLVHGDKDPLVPLQQSQSFDKALEAAGRTHRLIVVSGGAHGGDAFTPSYVDLLRWFVDHLDGK